MSEKKVKAERRAAREAERMKAWKIDVRPYKIQVLDSDENGKVRMVGGKPSYIDDDFDVREMLATILFHNSLNLRPAQAFEAHDLAKKIRNADGFVLLDNEEMKKVRAAYDVLEKCTEDTIEFLSRIRDAVEVNAEEALES